MQLFADLPSGAANWRGFALRGICSCNQLSNNQLEGRYGAKPLILSGRSTVYDNNSRTGALMVDYLPFIQVAFSGCLRSVFAFLERITYNLMASN